MAYVLALDQGTTSSRAIVFDAAGRVRGLAQVEFPQHFPAPDRVEHDPQDIVRTQFDCAREALANAGIAAREVAAIVADISAATLEQTRGIEQVNQTVTMMDQVTQQNAALVEEASAAARSLEEQAEGLAEAVGLFRL